MRHLHKINLKQCVKAEKEGGVASASVNLGEGGMASVPVSLCVGGMASVPVISVNRCGLCACKSLCRRHGFCACNISE